MTTYRTARIGVDILDAEGNVTRNIRHNVQGDASAWRDYQAHLDAGGAVLPAVVTAPPTAADDAYRAEARRRIDEAAGRARARYVTVGPAQDATYLAKYQQAQDYLAAGPLVVLSDYPWIEAEATACGMSGEAAATRIKTLGDAWAGTIGPAIEAARIAGKDAVTPLATRPEVDAQVAVTLATLGAI